MVHEDGYPDARTSCNHQARFPQNARRGTRVSDSWAYKELAESITAENKKKVPEPAPPLKGYTALLVNSLDDALEMVGRSGRDVLYGVLENRYALRSGDISTRTGTYMSALRDLLGSSATVVERYVLREVREETGIEAHTLEEAVAKLKKKFGED